MWHRHRDCAVVERQRIDEGLHTGARTVFFEEERAKFVAALNGHCVCGLLRTGETAQRTGEVFMGVAIQGAPRGRPL